MPKRIFKDRIIAYKKGKKYLAISLEFDLLAEGNSIMQAFERLHDATVGYLKMCCEDNEPDSEIYRKAQKKYQDIYNLFVELSEKKRKREDEKKKEKALRAKEISSIQRTYDSQSLCHA
jgi:hypothetical protein